MGAADETFSEVVVGLVGTCEMPVRAMVCVVPNLFNALSVTTREPLSVPVDVGVNSTERTQDAPAERTVEDEQLFATALSHVKLPVRVMLLKVSGMLPTFVSETD